MPVSLSGKTAEILWQVCLKQMAEIYQTRAVPPEELVAYAQAVFQAPREADGTEKRLPADDGIAF